MAKAKGRMVVRAEKLRGTFELNIEGCRSWSERKDPRTESWMVKSTAGFEAGRSMVAEELGKSQNRRAIGS